MTPAVPGSRLSSLSLGFSVVWNMIGLGVPLVLAVITIPVILEGFGLERFGLLALAWTVVGYFSLFDLGLSRALVHLIGYYIGRKQEDALPGVIWTALVGMVVFGLAGCLIAVLVSPVLVHRILNISPALHEESLRSFYLLSCSIPVVILTSGFRGVLEAHQRFALVNAVRVILGLMTFLGPLMVLPFSKHLFPVISLLLVCRILTLVFYVAICAKVTPQLSRGFSIRYRYFKQLIGFGGWVTVSSVVSPIMEYIDRFFIGTLLSITGVTYYVTPFEVITKLLMIPNAVVSVLFPTLSTVYQYDRPRAERLFNQGVKCIFIILFPIILIVFSLSREVLEIWLGSEFACHGYLVLQVLSLGILANSIAHVPFIFIQGIGKPRYCGLTHLVELPFFLALLWYLLKHHGIEGAAIAWTLRVSLDLLILLFLARMIDRKLVFRANLILLAILFVVLCFGSALLIQAACHKILFLFLALSIFFPGAWFLLFSLADRERILDSVKNELRRIPPFSRDE